MPPERVAIVCPDKNVRLWSTRVADAAMGGGKSAILQLGAAWARAGHEVTIASAAARPGASDGVSVCALEDAPRDADVAIYVTGHEGHFDDPRMPQVAAARTIFWLNGPGRPEPPRVAIDWYVAPARFVARRAADEWGFPADRVVVIPGESVRTRRTTDAGSREPLAGVYASHPFKGLREALEVVGRVRADHPAVRLDVYGSERLWGDDKTAENRGELPDFARAAGELPQAEIESRMERYGFLLYLTEWIDAFSSSTAEALAAGVVVVATAHGSNAELVRHGWNGFLVRARDGRPDLDQAESLLRSYLAAPEAFESVRANASASVPTWDEQAAAWRELWRAPRRPKR